MVHTLLRYLVIAALSLALSLGGGWGRSVQGRTCPDVGADMSQAQSLYEAGCSEAALQTLQRLSQQGTPLSQAAALGNLSLTYQQLGQWQAATEAVAAAFERLTQANQGSRLAVQAQLLDVRGQLQLARGQAETAAASWGQAARLHRRLNQPEREIVSSLNQARAMQALGLFQRVKSQLAQVVTTLDQQPVSAPKAAALTQLADVLRLTGDTGIDLGNGPQRTVVSLLSESWQLGQDLDRPDLQESALLSLGNYYRYRFFQAVAQPDVPNWRAYNDLIKAFYAYERVVAEGSSTAGLQAQLNWLSLQTDLARHRSTMASQPPHDPALASWLEQTADLPDRQRQLLLASLEPAALTAQYERILEQLEDLPSQRTAIYARISLARNWFAWRELPEVKVAADQIQRLLDQTVLQARQLQDEQAIAYALGYQGRFYEYRWQVSRHPADLSRAVDLTRQAMSQAQAILADDISYQWQHQLGRLLRLQGQRGDAIAAYRAAFETLESLRSDLIAANADQRFYFQDNIRPIYRELVELLLGYERGQQPQAVSPSPQQLDLVRRVMDALQVAELENFFQAACVDATVDLGQSLQPGEVGLYPIVLDDHRLDVILQLPGENAGASLRYFSARTDTSQTEAGISSLIQQIRDNLDATNPGAAQQLRTASQRLYPYIFESVEAGQPGAPTLAVALETTMASSDSRTLIFVLDGVLRAIPPGILYDGEQYLIEKYAIALNLGIEVRQLQPLPTGADLSILAAGVEVLGVAPFQRNILPGVPQELALIEQSGATVQRLPEEEFTQANFNRQLNQGRYQVVHLATHGQFASNREDTFILAKNERISVDRLSTMFRNTQAIQNPVELIVFSACRTAAGDDRAVLGLAGATVQAGARSAIATLWSVNDRASVRFAESFYDHLAQPNTSRAVALQQAQLDLKETYRGVGDYRHWAPYVLVGSWR